MERLKVQDSKIIAKINLVKSMITQKGIISYSELAESLKSQKQYVKDYIRLMVEIQKESDFIMLKDQVMTKSYHDDNNKIDYNEIKTDDLYNEVVKNEFKDR